MSKVLQEIFPGFGFFGNTKSSAAKVNIEKEISKIRFILKPEKPEFLNLEKIIFYETSEKIAQKEFKVSISSIFNDSTDFHPRYSFGSIINNLPGQFIHTKQEINPWIEAEFDNPTFIDSVIIFNRGDIWSSRNKSLSVEIWENEKWSSIWENQSKQNLDSITETIKKITKTDVIYKLQSNQDLEATREKIIKSITSIIFNTPNDLILKETPKLIALLNIWSEEKPKDHDLDLLAAYLFFCVNSDELVKNFSFIKNIASDTDTLNRLQERINYISEKRKAGYIVFSRHGLRKSQLISRSSEYIDLLNRISSALKEINREGCLLYGTLLGAIREKSFIPFDDDVDFGVISTACIKSQVRDDKKSLASFFLTRGFHVGNTESSDWNLHVISPKDGTVSIDVFLLFLEEEKVFLHMERMTIKSIPKNIILPFSKVYFYNQSFNCPAHPHNFLSERYGHDWERPNQFYEWPYQIQEITKEKKPEPSENNLKYEEFKLISERHAPSLYSEKDKFISYKKISIYFVLKELSLQGDWLQFGTFKGGTTQILESFVSCGSKLHLFDSSEWLSSETTSFEISRLDKNRTSVHQGRFKESIGKFKKHQSNPISLIHIDSDSYSLTTEILENLNEIICKETIILFDEFFLPSESGISDDECRAFFDWAKKFNRHYQILWRTKWVQCAIKILS